METIELINLCRQGDLDAFNALYNKYSKKALQTTYFIVGNKNIAEDIVQEAFYECFRSIKKLRKPELFEQWFNKLLIRICWRMSTKERHSTYESLDEAYDEAYDEAITNHTAVIDPFEDSDINVAVVKAINKLNTPLRTTVILFYYNDMSIKEISKVLNCLQGTVKSRLHNGRKYIETELRKDNIIFLPKEMKYKNKECVINE